MKLSIGKKLGLSFVVVVVVMVLAGGFALYQLDRSRAALRDISEHEMVAALAAFGIRANFDEMVWATKNLLLRGTDPEVLARELQVFDYKKSRLETLWQPELERQLKGPDITDEQRKLYDEFKRDYAAFLDAWEQALPVYKSEGQAAADAIMSGKGRAAGDYLVELVRSLRAAALKDMELASVRTRAAVTVMLVAFVVAVLIAAVVVVYIARELTMLANNLIEVTTKLKRGGKK